MTAAFEANDSLNIQPLELQTPQLINSLSNSDWQILTNKPTAQASALDASGQLSFGDDIYAQNASKAAQNLNTEVKDLQSLPKDSAAYKKDLANIDTDEKTLRQGVFALRDNSTSYQSFAKTMESEHDLLKSTAQDLWNMGLKDQAAETTAYFPLTNYEKYFDNKGGGSGSGSGGSGSGGDGGSGGGSGGDGSIAPPAGSTKVTAYQDANSEKPNTIPSQIGGNGGVTDMSATQVSPDSVDFSMTGKAWSDGLWLTSDKTPAAADAKQFQLSTDITLTQQQLTNDNEIEFDAVQQTTDGTHATVGTQINPKTGEVDFWNSTTSSWVDEGSIGPLQAGKTYDLQLGGSVNDTGNGNTGSYTYDYYALNGVKLDPTAGTTFKTEALNWAPGFYNQTQLDLGGDAKPGTVAGVTESNDTLYIN